VEGSLTSTEISTFSSGWTEPKTKELEDADADADADEDEDEDEDDSTFSAWASSMGASSPPTKSRVVRFGQGTLPLFTTLHVFLRILLGLEMVPSGMVTSETKFILGLFF
jgi:hypothetical protein